MNKEDSDKILDDMIEECEKNIRELEDLIEKQKNNKDKK